MKSFYSEPAAASSAVATVPDRASARDGDPAFVAHPARIAVYDGPAAAPRVEEIAPAPVDRYIESLASRIYELAREQGGEVPYTAIREVTENFIHADFKEPVVSVMDRGTTIRFADQGPGIDDKERALQPGFTSASSAMKRYIRGVGSGLPIVREYLTYSGGTLRVDDNLGGGAVITLITRPSLSVAEPLRPTAQEPLLAEQPALLESAPSRILTTRQKQVLALVMESGSAGPSLISRELAVGLSTAYRDLAQLEEIGLIAADEAGKRSLTEQGAALLDDLIRS